jgi:lipopolysaccharide/colanic/teichoic acid biosynthesis glycosyltransferase
MNGSTREPHITGPGIIEAAQAEAFQLDDVTRLPGTENGGAPALAGEPYPQRSPRLDRRVDEAAKRLVDVAVSALLLLVVSPLILLVAIAIKLESRGPVLYRGRRVGHRGAELWILKFRKMHESAAGPALTVSSDHRLTRLGRFLALSKLDELPQLWNVLRGDMSLVGPRPEHHSFAALHHDAYEKITQVRPGITGLSQLAFAEESRILDPDDRLGHYVERLLPQKTQMDQLYASRRSLGMDARILLWTMAAVLLRRDVAVHRTSGKLNLRRRPRRGEQVLPSAPASQPAQSHRDRAGRAEGSMR